MPQSVRPRHRSPLPTLLASALLSALFVFAMTAISLPGTAFASVAKEAACSVNLRTSASTSAGLKATLKTGTKVTVATSVTGTAWKATCNGKTIASRYWYRISAVNGKSAKSLYGTTYVYGALYLFRPVTSTSYTRYAACTAYLRTSPSTAAASKAIIATDTKVLVATPVTGAAWSATCAGKATSGAYWYQISAVNGQSVQSLYGVPYVYAPNGLFKPTATLPPAPTPTPTPATSVVEFSGDATGATDVSAAITSFLNNNKGKTVGFKAGGTYHVDTRIQIIGWTGTILGRGATFRRYATDAGRDTILRLIGGSNLRIDHLNVRGPATLSNVTNWTSWAREDEHALFIDSGTNITVVGGSFTNSWGDGIYIRERDSTYGIPNGIVLDGVVVDTNVRSGVSVTNGRNITLKNCKSSNSGLTGFDAEPNRTTDVIDNISIQNCEFRTFNAGHTPSSSGNGYAIYASAGATSSSDVVIDGNWFDRGAIYAIAPPGTRNQRITITNNSAGSAGVASIGRTDGLTFSGNSNIAMNIVYP